jgi:hypothetical protein
MAVASVDLSGSMGFEEMSLAPVPPAPPEKSPAGTNLSAEKNKAKPRRHPPLLGEASVEGEEEEEEEEGEDRKAVELENSAPQHRIDSLA